MDLGFDVVVTITGIVLVFLILILLMAIITLEGKIFDSMNAKKKAAKEAAKAPAVQPAAPVQQGRLEQEYADAKGIQISKPNFTDDFNKEYSDEWWVSSEGVALNDCAELQVDAPTIKPSVSGVTSICYLDFSLINAEGRKVGAAVNVPVGIGVSVPAGMDPAKVVVYHFAADGSIDEIIDPEWYVDETSGRDSVYFLVDHFSTFAIAEVETTGAEGSDNAFERYRDSIANEIANAKDGATVKITRDKNINALPNDIMQALYKKQTVALELEYTFEGNEYTVTIPAGKAEDNAIEWYGPLYLQMRYGK